jgi:release factor glutamine methyltransferase
MVTIAALVSTARVRLRDAGVADREAELDARLLAQEVLGWDAARLVASATEAPPPGFASAYDRCVSRRARREPMAYILRRQEFWGLTFTTTPAALIPRPESEIIVEAALELAARTSQDRRPFKVADAGTGTGCLAIALASEWPDAQVVATDLSNDALALAAANAASLGVRDRIQLVCADLLDVPRLTDGSLDMIVANPPYVKAADRDALPPEVRDYEPPLALFGGADGLDVVRRLIPESARRLRSGGHLIFEIGIGQSDAVRQLIAAAPGLTLLGIRDDLQHIPRTVIAVRR